VKFVRDPLLNLSLFRDRTFLTANVVGYVAVIALFGAEFLLPVYLQSLRGRSALQSGLILLPLAVTAGLMNPFAGRIYDKIGPRVLVIIGSIVLLVNTWQFAQLTAQTSVARILMLVGLRGLAISLIMQATFTTALGAVPRNAVPRGSSLVNSTRFLAQALGVALLATVLGSALSPAVRQLQQQMTSDTSSSQHVGLCESLDDKTIPTPDTQTPMRLGCEENLRGLRRAYTLTFCAAIFALVTGAFLPGWPLEWLGRGVAAAPASGTHGGV
jgi:DHA2 family multidrug resistance protein